MVAKPALDDLSASGIPVTIGTPQLPNPRSLAEIPR